MAFRLEIEQESGATARHWRVSYLEVNYDQRYLRAIVNGYVSRAAYEAGKSPLTAKSFEYAGDAFPLLSGQSQNVIQAIEAKVLSEPVFSNAIGE